MIGIYDYTVILTYISAISGCVGIFVTLNDYENLSYGLLLLLFCALCDAFDGTIARTKKNRTEIHKLFGIQIDSMSDLVAFGVLPSTIGYSILKNSFYSGIKKNIIFAIILMYLLSTIIRLSYYNVSEIIRHNTNDKSRIIYLGIPAPISALVLPVYYIIQHIVNSDLSILFFVIMGLLTILYLLKFKIPKPNIKGMIIICLVGAVEFVLTFIFR